MKKFTRVCLIVSGVLAVIGIVLCIAGAASGATLFGLGRIGSWVRIGGIDIDDITDDIRVDTDEISVGNIKVETNLNDSDYEKSIYTYEKEDIARIEDLDIEITAGTIEILPSENEKLIVETHTKRSSVKCGISDETFYIEDKVKWSLFGSNSGITIYCYLPSDMQFDEVSLKVNAGELYLKEAVLDAKDVTLDVGAGEMNLSELSAAEELEATVGAGEIHISEMDAGEIALNCGVGTIKMNGSIRGDVTADCGVGEIDLSLNGAKEDFNYTLDCGIGDISIGSDSYTSLGNKQKIDNDAAKRMNLDCGVGAIDVEFN